jgi:DNA-binding SARP family transcriptional activator
MIDKESCSVQVRVYLLGDLYVERRTSEGTWEAVPSDSEDWGPGTYARGLLRYLLCNGQRVGRGSILDTLWPDLDSADRYLNKCSC